MGQEPDDPGPEEMSTPQYSSQVRSDEIQRMDESTSTSKDCRNSSLEILIGGILSLLLSSS